MWSFSVAENTTNAPPWYRDTTQNTIGPSKLTTARPISAPCSSCSWRSDSGDPSKPDRFASTTSGRFPLAALIARAIFFDDRGNSVPAVNTVGPSIGVGPRRGSGRDSTPSSATGCPPRCASCTTTPSASSMSRSEEHTSELQSRQYLVCRLLLEKKKQNKIQLQRCHYEVHNLTM